MGVMDFLKELDEWVHQPGVSIIMVAIVKALLLLCTLFPEPANKIITYVLEAIDSWIEKGVEPTHEEKVFLGQQVANRVVDEYSNSPKAISYSWAITVVSLASQAFYAMRYGEDIEQYEQAEKIGILQTSENIKSAWKLFGV